MPKLTFPDRLKIKVTQADIDKGCKGDGENCPIALAFLRALAKAMDRTLPSSYTVAVDGTMAEVLRRTRNAAETEAYFERMASYLLPEKAATFVTNFDYDNHSIDPIPVKPFTMTVALSSGR